MPKFSDIIGQEQIKMHLGRAVHNKTLSHAYIISGERYCGKEFVAKALAEAVLCENHGDESCGECHSCRQARGGNNPDIIRITHEKPGSIGVNDIREQLIDDIVIKPYSGEYKVYIINEAEKMTPQAQNAILKTLEEPPAYAIILLLATGTESFLPTILSRCMVLEMKPVSNELIREYLIEELKVPESKVDMCVAFAAGNLGKARLLAMSEDFDEIRNHVLYVIKTLKDMDPARLTEAVKKAHDYKLDISDYLDIMAIWFRDVLLFKATSDANGLIFKEELSSIREAVGLCDYEGIENIIKGIDVAKHRLAANVSFELTMELLFLTIKDAGN